MPNSSVICCDTNLVVNWATQSANSPASIKVGGWFDDGRTFVAPLLLRYEVTNVLYRREKLGLIPAGAAKEGLEAILTLDIHFATDLDLHFLALNFAQRFKLGAAYDAHFLALSHRDQCEFWTGDKRLFNTVQPHFPLIRYLDHDDVLK